MSSSKNTSALSVVPRVYEANSENRWKSVSINETNIYRSTKMTDTAVVIGDRIVVKFDSVSIDDDGSLDFKPPPELRQVAVAALGAMEPLFSVMKHFTKNGFFRTAYEDVACCKNGNCHFCDSINAHADLKMENFVMNHKDDMKALKHAFKPGSFGFLTVQMNQFEAQVRKSIHDHNDKLWVMYPIVYWSSFMIAAWTLRDQVKDLVGAEDGCFFQCNKMNHFIAQFKHTKAMWNNLAKVVKSLATPAVNHENLQKTIESNLDAMLGPRVAVIEDADEAAEKAKKEAAEKKAADEAAEKKAAEKKAAEKKAADEAAEKKAAEKKAADEAEAKKAAEKKAADEAEAKEAAEKKAAEEAKAKEAAAKKAADEAAKALVAMGSLAKKDSDEDKGKSKRVREEGSPAKEGPAKRPTTGGKSVQVMLQASVCGFSDFSVGGLHIEGVEVGKFDDPIPVQAIMADLRKTIKPDYVQAARVVLSILMEERQDFHSRKYAHTGIKKTDAAKVAAKVKDEDISRYLREAAKIGKGVLRHDAVDNDLRAHIRNTLTELSVSCGPKRQVMIDGETVTIAPRTVMACYVEKELYMKIWSQNYSGQVNRIVKNLTDNAEDVASHEFKEAVREAFTASNIFEQWACNNFEKRRLAAMDRKLTRSGKGCQNVDPSSANDVSVKSLASSETIPTIAMRFAMNLLCKCMCSTYGPGNDRIPVSVFVAVMDAVVESKYKVKTKKRAAPGDDVAKGDKAEETEEEDEE